MAKQKSFRRTRVGKRAQSQSAREPMRSRSKPPAPPVEFDERSDGDGDGQEMTVEQRDTSPDLDPSTSFSIVGVGASAGGLEAFTQMISAVAPDTGMAIVLIQHLSPNHESALPELLSAATSLPVAQVQEGVEIKPDHVYVTPPNVHVSISEGRFRLIPRPHDRTQHSPIDFFLRSLAEYAQARAIGVILSGTASDGAAGLKEIKAVGGITLAQAPQTAKYDGMPRAAVATGAVDLVLSPHEIAAELSRISEHPFVRHVQVRTKGDQLEIPEEHLRKIFGLLKAATGVDFNQYKQPTIRRRLQRRMVLHKLTSVEQYLKFLERTSEEVLALYSDILIHVTRFFREPESFETLRDVVFPMMIRQHSPEDPIRIWIPGCATGEEAYSTAMALVEFMEEQNSAVPIQIFATDVSEAAIEFARAGTYPDSITGDVAPERLRRFFSRVDGSYRISKTIRDMCVFARQDLTRDPPFSRLDLIVCRNVLIYLGMTLQKKLMNVFHYALKPDGFLMLGSAETVGGHADLFSVADKKYRLYVRKMAVSHPDIGYPRGEGPAAGELSTSIKSMAGSPPLRNFSAEANRVLIDRYSPAAVIVDNDLLVVQFRGRTGAFLEPAPGEASLNVLKMARDGLLYGLRSAINEARRTGKSARKEGLRVRDDGNWSRVNLQVIPLGIGEVRHFLIIFEEVGRAGKAKKEAGRAGKKAGKRGMGKTDSAARLKLELEAGRDYLQSIIQDLEAANEELQSANEEILSSNEELQSTNEELDTAKEELQSTNEELHTVNEELHERNEELIRVNSDLVNLLASVQIAIVMVGSDQRIRRFTPTAERVLNLIPGDVGRPISDIKPNINIPDLDKLIRESIDEVSTVERSVTDRQGNSYLMRIRPYKSVDQRIDGAVVVLFDVETARRHEQEARHARELFEAATDAVRESLLVLDSDLRVIRANSAFHQQFFTTPEEVQGNYIYELGNRQWDIPQLRTLLEDVLPRDNHIDDFEVKHDFPGLGPRVMKITARRMSGVRGQDAVIILGIRDHTDGKKEEQK